MPTNYSSSPEQERDDDVIDILKGLVAHIDSRFDEVDARLRGTQEELAAVEKRLTDRIERVESKIDGFSNRVDIAEDKIRQLAVHTGYEFSK